MRLLAVEGLLALSLLATISARAEWKQATVNGHVLFYEDLGRGTPVVFLHGGGSTPEKSFSKQLPVFSARHRVIAPEQTGHGKSPPLPGPLSYAKQMEDTAALLDSLHLSPVDVVGFSDGAIVGLMLAGHHPGLVRRLVASGANFRPDGVPADDMKSGQEALRKAQAKPRDQWTLGDKLNELWLTQPTPDELGPEVLRKIQIPVLVMAGDHDAITLAHTLEIYSLLPHAKLWILPATHHATFSERPDWVNPLLLSFLEETDALPLK